MSFVLCERSQPQTLSLVFSSCGSPLRWVIEAHSPVFTVSTVYACPNTHWSGLLEWALEHRLLNIQNVVLQHQFTRSLHCLRTEERVLWSVLNKHGCSICKQSNKQYGNALKGVLLIRDSSTVKTPSSFSPLTTTPHCIFSACYPYGKIQFWHVSMLLLLHECN